MSVFDTICEAAANTPFRHSARIAGNMTKPVSAYIAGVTAPPGKKMGHAGAIVSGGRGTARAKMEALAQAGGKVGENPTAASDLRAAIVSGPD